MTFIVINSCYGGYGLSDAAIKELIEIGALTPAKYIPQEKDSNGNWLPDTNPPGVVFDNEMTPLSECDSANALDLAMRYHRAKADGREDYFARRYWGNDLREDRSNPHLVEVVRKLGDKANGRHAELKVIEIPDGVEWEIKEYDGREHVAEQHRTWS